MNVWLTLHVIGVVLFLGNIVTAAFWKIRADATKDAAVVHQAVKNVMLADYVFTLPGLVLLIASGNAMAVKADLPMSGLNWLTASLVLFAITGVIWIAFLLPLQRAMIRHSAASLASGTLSQAYKNASRNWAIFGIAATLIPIVILYFMISQDF
ncbi:DUF2269 family protein [Cohnella suwonensis]|uniref:DUF2269 family protein n=1 Tax=Cohnella suwonensis TaxID=696072 RepID=A0ABW0LZ58_9BACL